MKTIKQVINSKGSDVKSVSPDTETINAIKLMATNGISSLLVIDDGKVVGIFSDTKKVVG